VKGILAFVVPTFVATAAENLGNAKNVKVAVFDSSGYGHRHAGRKRGWRRHPRAFDHSLTTPGDEVAVMLYEFPLSWSIYPLLKL
jgi:hypothetical protein